MSRRARVGCFIGVLVLLMACFVWWLLPSKIRTANSALLKRGMTVDEVRDIFGRPPDQSFTLPNGEVRRTWADDDIWIHVTFAEGRVVEAVVEGANMPGFRAQIRKWLGWY